MADVGPGTQLGRYTLEHLIASGGFGQVFRAQQAGPGGFVRHVAIKVLSTAALQTDRGLEVFMREARVAAGLAHRNIVQVHEVGQQGGVHYLVMELVDGLNLRQIIECWGEKLPLWLRVGVLLDVCRGLIHAHGARQAGGPIIHRDIKPSNILVSVQGDVKLTDFGLAKPFRDEQDLTKSGAVKGTPAFMSPEQQAGGEVTPASDVYSLGMVLFRTCGPDGRPPPEVSAIVASTMQPIAEQRPDAVGLGTALEMLLERLAPVGSVARFGEELGRWVSRAQHRLGGPQSGGETLDLPGDAVDAHPVPQAAGFAPEVVVVADPHVASQPTADAPTGQPVSLSPTTTETPHGAPPASRYRWLVFTALLAVIAGAGAVVAIWLPATDPPFPMALDGSVGHPLLRGPRVVPLDAADVRAPMGDAAAHGAPDVVASPDASKPDAGKPDAGKPDAGKPDAAKPARDAASAKRSRPRPTGRGYLSVDSRPWSRIYIDGRRVGITPLWRQRVSAGWRRVRLVSARRSASRRVRIRHGRHTNLGMINLR